MWARLAFVMVAVVALGNAAHAAWWCEPLHGYYPWVRSCPEPWRQVDPGSASQQPQQPHPVNQPRDTGTAPVPSSAAAQPTFPSPVTADRGDGLDAWCRGSITALNIAICTDDDLRAEAVQRLHAFDDARGRLTPDQQRTLTADQNGWAMSYAQSCGLHSDAAPTLPLAPSVKECLARAGQRRLAYLRSYGAAATNAASPQTATPPPASAADAAPAIPGTASGTVSADAASTAQQAKTQAASSAEIPPAVTPPAARPPANSSPSPDDKALPANTPAISCGAFATHVSANPFGGGRIPALGTLQGKTMAGSVALAAATICLWIFAVFRNARRQPH